MQFSVLGPLQVRPSRDTRVEPRATKPGALLAVLLLNANAWVSVDQLIGAIWHEQAVPASAVRNLRSYVWQLRRSLGERLEGGPCGYRLRVCPGERDSDQVERLAESARSAMAAGEYETAAERLSGALSLWRGEPFEGLVFEAATAAATRLNELRREVNHLLADACLELGRTSEATRLLRELTEREPWCESSWARLVLALHQAGRTDEALAAFERIRKLLLDELGVGPGPELAAAQRKVLHGRKTMSTTKLSLVVGGRPAPAHAEIDTLLASARHEVLIMSDGPGSGPIDALRRIARTGLHPGVRYRVLCPDSARLSSALRTLSLAGADVRTDAEVPMQALVIDRGSALLPADRESTGYQAGAAVFRLPGVVTATVGLFERIWQGAVPLLPSEPAEAGDGVLTRRERDLLALLCSGSTDESAAARLGISVRTVRRMVADIMNRLGARSRFQAGVKAADRGWLMDMAG
ncbi:BTAD domain-containing putative transcriptional regulator [Amycolatopsis rhizosphaerae]|nr:BTAD domain-containing putative transcriptional regulator [Amycolatopsis rhizosphaerae]